MDQLDSFGYSALHRATRDGLIEACQLLIEHGADPNLPESSSRRHSPLALAALQGQIHLVDYYLSLPAVDVNVWDGRGDTALMFAIKIKNREVARLLATSSRVDLRVRNSEGRTAADVAAEWWKGNSALRSLLRRA